jgi:hypothetical protein
MSNPISLSFDPTGTACSADQSPEAVAEFHLFSSPSGDCK